MERIVEIDLSKTTTCGGAGLEVGPTYIFLKGGTYFKGVFCSMPSGHLTHWNGTYMDQYDPPQDRVSDWQRVWRVDDPTIPEWMSGDAALMLCGLDPVKIRADEEMPMAIRRRDMCIKFHCTYRDVLITEASPIEAYLYGSKIPKMPGPYPGDQEDE